MKMNNPLMSVIVPIYNAEEHLAKCLSAIANQAVWDIEIICIDDASTDGSLGIVEKFASRDMRFFIVSRKTRSGSNEYIRNTGLELARGKHVVLINPDGSDDLGMLENLCAVELP